MSGIQYAIMLTELDCMAGIKGLLDELLRRIGPVDRVFMANAAARQAVADEYCKHTVWARKMMVLACRPVS